MSQWDGKTKGTLLGYKIFVFSIRYLGLYFSYFILALVALYYYIFDRKANQALTHYYQKRLGYNRLQTMKARYQSYFVFGQTLIDKTAIGTGLINRYTYECDGVENLQELIKNQSGGVLISAHVGNFEVSKYFFDDLLQESGGAINLVTTDRFKSDTDEYLETVSQESTIKLINIKDDFSHIFAINAALDRSELVCFTGDRYFEGVKTLRGSLLGEEAIFPAGPFLISSRLKAPVIAVYVMREKNFHYHLYARKIKAKARDANGLLEAYIQQTEQMIQKYPTQWFNFFNFWAKP